MRDQTNSPRERVIHRLTGQPVDRAPNFDIIMAYGVRHIGAKLRDYYLDYRILVQMNLAMIEDFQLDIAQTLTDPYREACDWGLEVDFPEDYLPMRIKPLLEAPGDLNRLKKQKGFPGRRMTDRIEAVRALKEQVGSEVPVMGWVEGALAEANDLRGDSTLMTDFYDRPEWLVDLLETLTEVEIEFARMQIEAGADMIGLGDAIASTISPRMYRQFALPYEQRIFSAVKAMGAVPRLHICGDTHRIVPDMLLSGASIIDLDWMVDFGKAAAQVALPGSADDAFSSDWQGVNAYAEKFGPALCGNMDPVRILMQGTEEEVNQATWRCLEAGGSRCISAAGCEIPVGTPPENIHAQNRAIADFAGKRDSLT